MKVEFKDETTGNCSLIVKVDGREETINVSDCSTPGMIYSKLMDHLNI